MPKPLFVMRKILPSVLLLLLYGCNSHSDPSKTAARSQGPLTVELSSPDLAVKSWWRVNDAIEARGDATCKDRMDRFAKSDEYKARKDISIGPANTNFDVASTCLPQTYGREIVAVKIESETRAVVLARIRATTPIPAGATPSSADIKYREEGFPYKYVVEKAQGKWRVSQVYTYNSYADGDPWRPVFEDHPMVLVHAYLTGDH